MTVTEPEATGQQHEARDQPEEEAVRDTAGEDPGRHPLVPIGKPEGDVHGRVPVAGLIAPQPRLGGLDGVLCGVGGVELRFGVGPGSVELRCQVRDPGGSFLLSVLSPRPGLIRPGGGERLVGGGEFGVGAGLESLQFAQRRSKRRRFTHRCRRAFLCLFSRRGNVHGFARKCLGFRRRGQRWYRNEMRAEPEVLDFLNELLTSELTAINQYFIHYKMCANQGYGALAHKKRAESIEEMKHADAVIERILFLDGVPNMQRGTTVHVGLDC